MWTSKVTSKDSASTSTADPAQGDASNATSAPSNAFTEALAGNRAWATSFREKSPSLLASLAKGQKPRILWIGCSDSRVPETTLLNLQPGDVFTHRNIANIVSATDASCAAVVQYAVTALGVQHVVLCGHTGCGGAQAALGNKALGGVLDLWLMPLRAVRSRIWAQLQGLEAGARWKRLVVENVRAGVAVLREDANIIKAVEARGLTVHGVVYDIATGELEEVDIEEDSGDGKTRVECFGME